MGLGMVFLKGYTVHSKALELKIQNIIEFFFDSKTDDVTYKNIS